MKYRTLIDTYNNCQTLTIKVTINGANIDLSCDYLHVSLSISDLCDACTIRYRFDHQEKFCKYQNKWQLGSILEIAIGYENTFNLVFLGYVHEIQETHKNQHYDVEIYGQDVFGLMMNHQRLFHYKQKSAQQILEMILKDDMYTNFIKNKKIESKSDEDKTFTQWQESDYETLRTICHQKGLWFYMQGDTCIVATQGSSQSPSISIDEEDVETIGIQMSATHLLGKIETYARDEKQTTMMKSQNTSLSKFPIVSNTFNKLTKIKRFERVMNAQQCSEYAKQAADAIDLSIGTISFCMSYAPELLCGKQLDFTNIPWIKKTCVITELEIMYDDQHFWCEGMGIIL